MTAEEVIAIIRPINPNRRFAINKRGDAVGVWDERLNKFSVLYTIGIDGRWWNWGPMDICVNGVPVFAPEDWEDCGTGAQRPHKQGNGYSGDNAGGVVRAI